MSRSSIPESKCRLCLKDLAANIFQVNNLHCSLHKHNYHHSCLEEIAALSGSTLSNVKCIVCGGSGDGLDLIEVCLIGFFDQVSNVEKRGSIRLCVQNAIKSIYNTVPGAIHNKEEVKSVVIDEIRFMESNGFPSPSSSGPFSRLGYPPSPIQVPGPSPQLPPDQTGPQ